MNTILVVTTILIVFYIRTNEIEAGKSSKANPPFKKWDSLKVQWSLKTVLTTLGKTPFLKLKSIFGFARNPDSEKRGGGFFDLPRTPQELDKDKSWIKLNDKEPCHEKDKFYLGWRYARKFPSGSKQDYDRSVVILTDVHDYVVGMQSSIPKRINGNSFSPRLKKEFYADDGEYWTQTVYFIDPRLICQGRTPVSFAQEGTGTQLWLQRSPDPYDPSLAVPIPLSEEELQTSNTWGSGKCVPSMGKHYWYNINKNMACQDFIPYCLLYNKGMLSAFCFVNNVELPEGSYDTPAPKPSQLWLFIEKNKVPTCLRDDKQLKQLSTLHVYFRQNPVTSSNC